MRGPSYIREFPFSKVKIARALVAEVATSVPARSIIHMIVSLASDTIMWMIDRAGTDVATSATSARAIFTLLNGNSRMYEGPLIHSRVSVQQGEDCARTRGGSRHVRPRAVNHPHDRVTGQ